MTTTSTPRDRWTYGGMLAVAVAAAVLSFSSLAGLAGLAGITGSLPLPAGGRFRLAWLLPIAVDAYAVTATRVWLRTAGSARTRGYARRNAVGAIVLSVAGNAAFHALTAAGVSTLAGVTGGWAVVVAVSAVPPVMLGLVGHLHALVSDDHRPAPAAGPAGVAPPRGVGGALPAGSGTPGAVPAGGGAGRTGTAGAGRSGRRPGTRTAAGSGSGTGGRAGRTDAELSAALVQLPREPDGTVPIRRATAALGCGPDRARRLLAGAGLLRAPAGPAAASPAATAPTTADQTPDPAELAA